MTLSRPALSALMLTLLAGCGADDAQNASQPASVASTSTGVRARASIPPLIVPVLFPGKLADYIVVRTGAGLVVTAKAGGEAVTIDPSVGTILFDDLTLATSNAGVAALAFRLYQAGFDRVPDSGGLGFHISVMEGAGIRPAQVAEGFVDSAEFKSRYGALDNAALLTQLYRNILHRAPDPAGLAYWLGLLDGKAISRGEVLLGFADSPENTALVAPAIEHGIAYAPYNVGGVGSAVTAGQNKVFWNASARLGVLLRDARGQAVPGNALACSVPAPAILTVSADCRTAIGQRLGEQDVLVSGAGVNATLRVKVIPQRQLLGTQSSAGSGSGGYNLHVTSFGNVLAWGANHSLVLGQGSSFGPTSALPVAVRDADGMSLLSAIVSSSAGETDAMAVTESGQVLVWGELHDFARSGPKKLPSLVRNPANNGPLNSIVQVGVGAANAVALADDGRVFTWGRYSGQGVESEIKFPNQPKNTDGAGALGGIVQVAAGFNHTLALGANGKVYAWGWNSYGETGRGTAQTQEVLPATVKLADGSELGNIVQVVAGYHYSMALTADGRVYAWGDNGYEQLGLGAAHGKHYSAELVKDVSGTAPLGNIVMIAAGKLHALALDANGRVLSWGWAKDGRLGDGVNGNRAFNGRPMPVVGADGLGELGSVVSIGAGPDHSLAVLANGTLMTWGDGYGGSLGQGATGVPNADLSLPAPVRRGADGVSLALTLAAYPNLRNRAR